MLKTMTLSTLARPAYNKTNKNEHDIDDNSSIDSNGIDNRNANLSNSTKKNKLWSVFSYFQS